MPLMKDMESRTLLCVSQNLTAGSRQKLSLCQQDQIAVNKLTQIIKHISQDLILHRTGTAGTRD